MPHSIASLTDKRQRWIDVNRENNFEEGIKRLLTELYPDNAHFIFELLQNAEDPKANVVRFTLSDEEVEFEHNGDRLFDLKDVESITSIGASTKREDPTSIGEFGVGFKAVFAYTSTPEIHSGDFHFRIEDLVVPVTNGVKNMAFGDKETRFIFPFDHPTKRPPQATEEIKRGLQALGDNTLLFLNHIHLIEYLLPDGSLGSLERIDHNDGHIEIHAFHPGGKKLISHWLRYQKDIVLEDESGKTKTCRVAIAFSLQHEDNKKNDHKWEITPLDHGQVSIYFPAEKETSGLRFHIHAPFASTVARDSVRDCEANLRLRDAIAKLAVESLSDIRDRGLLTMRFLSVLPNESDNLTPFYEPIRMAIVEAFRSTPLTPTRSGSFASASMIYRGPGRISDVLNDKDMAVLGEYEIPTWAANPPQQNQREDRFLSSLGIQQFTWDNLVDLFSVPHLYADEEDEEEYAENLALTKLIEDWVHGKDDKSVQRFYGLLGEACENHHLYFNFDGFRIVRVRAPNGQAHVTPEQAFLSPESEGVTADGVYFVLPSVYNSGRSEQVIKYVSAFFEIIGVRPYNARTIVELKLQDYERAVNKPIDSHCEDLKQVIEYWKNNPEDVKFIKQKLALLCESENHPDYCRPEELCLDAPYLETGLSELTEIHNKRVLWQGYRKKFDAEQLNDFIELMKEISVMYELEVTSAYLWDNPQHRSLLVSNARETDTCFRKDYSIKGLDVYLRKQSISASRLIWQALIGAKSQVARAQYRPNQQYPIREASSQLVYHLKARSWIPDRFGVYHKPEDLTADTLRTDFPYDDRNGLLTAIGFGENARKLNEEYVAKNREAKNIGFESVEEANKMVQLAHLLRGNGQSPDTLIEKFRPTSKKELPSFPSRTVTNPERRQERVGEQISFAPEKEYEKRERSVRVTNGTIDPVTWLRNQYTNQDDEMVCQICKEEMPFRKRDGTHYFEKKELLSRDYLPKEHVAQYLALCPLCAAKYDEFIKPVDEVMAELREQIVKSDDCEVPIRFGDEKASIRFVESHYFDLKTIIESLD